SVASGFSRTSNSPTISILNSSRERSHDRSGRMLHCPEVDVRRFAIASILAVCLGGPVAEMFDQWDHTLQDGNDTEANMVVVALCFGVALSVAGIVVSHIRAMS